jgi:hypothetical protein
MPPSFQAAVSHAATHAVRLAELQKNAGDDMAEKLKYESALVSTGAASALMLGTAACVMLASKCGIRDLPNEVSRTKNEVIIQGPRLRLRPCSSLLRGPFLEVETLPEYEDAYNDETVSSGIPAAASMIVVGVWMLRDGEDLIVGAACTMCCPRRVRESDSAVTTSKTVNRPGLRYDPTWCVLKDALFYE